MNASASDLSLRAVFRGRRGRLLAGLLLAELGAAVASEAGVSPGRSLTWAFALLAVVAAATAALCARRATAPGE